MNREHRDHVHEPPVALPRHPEPEPDERLGCGRRGLYWDGRCDLYFCGIGGTNALFRNLGNWRFEDVHDSGRRGG